MPAGRKAIPRQLLREIQVEASHRCGVCRETSGLEVAHIEPWAKVQRHEFNNMIYLCAICHYRFDRNEIDRKSMRQYKANLAVLNGRYSDFERRILQYFADSPELEAIDLPAGNEIHLMYLIRDGHLSLANTAKNEVFNFVRITSGMIPLETYALTNSGRRLVDRVRRGLPVE